MLYNFLDADHDGPSKDFFDHVNRRTIQSPRTDISVMTESWQVLWYYDVL